MIAELERQAGAWEYARRLRRYVRAAKRALGPPQFIWPPHETPLNFLAWAERYVDELDPLQPLPLYPDRRPESAGYGGVSEQTVRTVAGRWLNRDEYVTHKPILEARDPRKERLTDCGTGDAEIGGVAEWGD